MTSALSNFQPQAMSFAMAQVELPRLRIDPKTGEFVHDFGDRWQDLQAVIIKANDPSRVMWPEEFKRGNQPRCKSNNGLWPVVRDPALNPYGLLGEDGQRQCLGCEMADWVENGGERLKPACAEVVNLLLVEIETEMPGVLSLARTRYRVAQNLSSFWAMTNFRFAVRLTTRLERGPSGEWYMVEFQRGEKFEAEQRQALAELYQQTKGWQLAALASELTLLDIEEPINGHLTDPKSDESLTERATLLHGEPETGIE